MVTREEGMTEAKMDGYWIEESEDPTYFAGHSASIHVKVAGKHHVIGSFGIMHPSVLKHFELP